MSLENLKKSYLRFTGAIQSRTSSVVACKDTASCTGDLEQSSWISGTRPTVDTVTCKQGSIVESLESFAQTAVNECLNKGFSLLEPRNANRVDGR